MKLYDFSLLFIYIGSFSIIIPLLLGTYIFNNLTYSLKIFYWGLFIIFIIDVLMLFFDNEIGNTFLYILSGIDLIFMVLVFYFEINNQKFKILVLIMAIIFLLLIFIDAFYISGIKSKGFSNIVERLFIMAVAIYYLTKQFQKDIELNLSKQPMVWICIGIIVYNFVGAFDLFSNAISIYSRNIYLQYYFFWGIISTLMYLSFAYAFYLTKFRESQSISS